MPTDNDMAVYLLLHLLSRFHIDLYSNKKDPILKLTMEMGFRERYKHM